MSRAPEHPGPRIAESSPRPADCRDPLAMRYRRSPPRAGDVAADVERCRRDLRTRRAPRDRGHAVVVRDARRCTPLGARRRRIVRSRHGRSRVRRASVLRTKLRRVEREPDGAGLRCGQRVRSMRRGSETRAPRAGRDESFPTRRIPCGRCVRCRRLPSFGRRVRSGRRRGRRSCRGGRVRPRRSLGNLPVDRRRFGESRPCAVPFRGSDGS